MSDPPSPPRIVDDPAAFVDARPALGETLATDAVQQLVAAQAEALDDELRSVIEANPWETFPVVDVLVRTPSMLTHGRPDKPGYRAVAETKTVRYARSETPPAPDDVDVPTGTRVVRLTGPLVETLRREGLLDYTVE